MDSIKNAAQQIVGALPECLDLYSSEYVAMVVLRVMSQQSELFYGDSGSDGFCLKVDDIIAVASELEAMAE
jgi:hypothetical protein